jgi:branched-chain amino acid transport system substrate-binding protein
MVEWGNAVLRSIRNAALEAWPKDIESTEGEKMKPSNFVAAALAAMIVIMAAAGSALAAGKPTCGLSNGTAATGAPIPIGSINGVTGPDDFSSSGRAADAYFKCVNANGGINGRPVKYIMADDQWKPDVAAQVATKLVQDDKVVAMIGSNSVVECGANAGLYDRENVMVIDIGVVHECFTTKNTAPINQGPRLSGIGMLIYAAEHLGAKKAACVAWNVPGTVDWICRGFADWGKKHGVTVQNVIVDPSSSDWTSAMLQASALNPDVILLGFSKGGYIQALAAAEEQDFGGKFKFTSLASGYVVGLPTTIGKYWNDRFWTQLEFTPLDGTGPDNQNWIAIMDTYGSKTDPRDTFSQGGYLAAKIATEAMLKLDPAKIDRASVSAALRAVKDVKSDILCGSWYVGDGARHNANHRGLIAVAHDGGWKTESGCFDLDDPELDDIDVAEKSKK